MFSVVKARRWLLVSILGFLVLGSAFTPVASCQQDAGRKVKVRVKPIYPDMAKRMGISGVVRIQATVNASGSVVATKVLGGHPMLINAALDALKRWKYEPASKETTEVVAFDFNNNNE